MRFKQNFILVVLLGLAMTSATSILATSIRERSTGTTSPNNILDQIRIEQERQAKITAPRFSENVPRGVMKNPYDEIENIQRAQKASVRKNAMKIAKMSLLISVPVTSADALIKNQIALLLIKPTAIDTEAAKNLLNLDAEPLVAKRIARIDVKRNLLVPSLSMVQSGETLLNAPDTFFLENWELIKSSNGENIVGRTGDPRSRIRVRVGMILGEYGRVVAVRDTIDAYYLVLESGMNIRGVPSAILGLDSGAGKLE